MPKGKRTKRGLTLSRRTALKLMGAGGLTLYLRPATSLFAAPPAPGMSSAVLGMSPIDRSLPNVAPKIFFGDDPEIPHKILWDKAGFISSMGGKLPEPSEKVPLVVIGGGISGLTTSYLLREHKPILLEQAKRFGGNSKGQAWQGENYSIGAAYFIEPEADTDIAKLMTELGIDKLWKIKEGDEPFELKGKLYNDFWSGVSAPDAKEQIKKLEEYFEKVNVGEEVTFPDIPVTEDDQWEYIKELDGEPFKAHLEKIAGGPLHAQVETALEHYCWSSFGAAFGEIGAASGLNFYASEFGNIAVLPGGNSLAAEKMLEAVAAAVPPKNLRAGSLVFDVRVTAEGVNVAYRDPAGKVQVIQAKACVLACPKFVVNKILQEIEPERVEAIRKLRYHAYLVANVMLNGSLEKPFYDLYMLGSGKVDSANIPAAVEEQQVTDVVMGTYAKGTKDKTILTLYRALPYDGGRAIAYAPDAYDRYRKEFEKQITESILPMLKLRKENMVDLRIARWGHPLPVAATGLIKDGTVEALRKPFKDKVFFVDQDNWALPAFETAVTEALTWAPEVEKVLKA